MKGTERPNAKSSKTKACRKDLLCSVAQAGARIMIYGHQHRCSERCMSKATQAPSNPHPANRKKRKYITGRFHFAAQIKGIE